MASLTLHRQSFYSVTVLTLSLAEVERVKLKAIEQALQAARLARTDPAPLLPITANWPFPLTVDDQRFLRSCVPGLPISPA